MHHHPENFSVLLVLNCFLEMMTEKKKKKNTKIRSSLK